jgi:hypothetical protein
MNLIKNTSLPLPRQIQIDRSFCNYDGDTAAMLYVKHRGKLPPLCLAHNSGLINEDGYTIAMLTLEYVENITELPLWMKTIFIYEIEKRTDRFLAMLWIKNIKTEPPKWMRPHSSFCSPKGTMAIEWIRSVEQEPPRWMLHRPGLRGLFDDTMAIAWIEHMKTEPPEYMRHKPIVCGNNSTMATKWIRTCKSEPPVWMRTAPEYALSDETMAMAWIATFKEEPPVWMRHPPDVSASKGTMATVWIEHMKSEPLDYMIHEADLVPFIGTMATTWIKFMKTEPLEYMRHKPELRTPEGTMAMLWVKYVGSIPPDYMKHCPKIRNEDWKTIREIWGTRPDMPKWMDYEYITKKKVDCAHKEANYFKFVACPRCEIYSSIICDELCPICQKEENVQEGDTQEESTQEEENIEINERLEDIESSENNEKKHIFCEICLKEWMEISPERCPHCNNVNR